MTRLENHYLRKGRVTSNRRFSFLLAGMSIVFWSLYLFNQIDPDTTEITIWIGITVMTIIAVTLNHISMKKISEIEHIIASNQSSKDYMNEETDD